MPGNLSKPIEADWAPKRSTFFFVVVLLMVAAVIIRLLNLSVMKGSEYAQLSQDNCLHNRTIDAPRGTIHDRHGTVLAYNRATFAVSMSRGNLSTQTIHSSLQSLSRMLGTDYTPYYRQIVRLRPHWKSQKLAQRMALDDVTAILEQRYAIPGVEVEPQFQRYYPLGATLCHLLGRVGKIPPQQWRRADRKFQNAGYEFDDEYGVSGIEAAFETLLRGKKGLETVLQSSRGRILDAETVTGARPGSRLYLTLDIALQQAAEDLLQPFGYDDPTSALRGVIMAADPRTGEILAWANAPGYDLNDRSNNGDPSGKPKLNRAIQEYYQPGSSFKIITSIAALEMGWDPTRRVSCGKYFYLPNWGHPFKCLHYHGPLDLVKGLQKSCNVQFYTLAFHILRNDFANNGYHLVETAQRFGFGSQSRVAVSESNYNAPGFEEKRGRLPTMEQLKKSRGSLLHLAIGQGLLDVTPLQMLMAYSALANGGELLTPRLVHEVRDSLNRVTYRSTKHVRRSTGLKPQHREIIMRGLFAAANEKGGTASRAGFRPEWRVAGKTSTAQNARSRKSDAWFIGLAPVEDPEIVVLILVEEGGHGGATAAPLATKMFEQYFRAHAPPQPLEPSPQELASGKAEPASRRR